MLECGCTVACGCGLSTVSALPLHVHEARTYKRLLVGVLTCTASRAPASAVGLRAARRGKDRPICSPSEDSVITTPSSRAESWCAKCIVVGPTSNSRSAPTRSLAVSAAPPARPPPSGVTGTTTLAELMYSAKSIAPSRSSSSLPSLPPPPPAATSGRPKFLEYACAPAFHVRCRLAAGAGRECREVGHLAVEQGASSRA